MKKLASIIVEKRKYVFILYVLLAALSAFGMMKVNVNYDMSKYLPDGSATKEGMERMTEEFGEMASITVMFDDLTEEEPSVRKAELEEIPGVVSVIFMPSDEAYQRGNHFKYMVTVSANTYSEEARAVLKAIREKYENDEVYLSGSVADNELLVTTIVKEIPIIVVVAVAIIFIILFLLCDSWIEPFLYMTCIGVAVLLNMGTNALLPSVSFMTFSIGALLQMGLSMDYSFMLMNRYNQEKPDAQSPADAMKKALCKAFTAITGSSVTTIVGLLALVFMSFKIGRDMGIVLAKGVLISLICIFTVLPGLTVTFDSLIVKTHKRSLAFSMKTLMKLVAKGRFIIVPVVLVLAIGSVMLQDRLNISYIKMFENEDQKKIEEAFGVDNQMILLYSNAEASEHIDSYIAWLQAQEQVNSVQDYSNTLGRKYTYTELSAALGMEPAQAKLLYQLYLDQQNTGEFEKITLYELICFLDDNILHDAAYAEFIAAGQTEEIEAVRQQLEAGKLQIDAAMAQLDEAEQQLIQLGMPADEITAQRDALLQEPAYAMIYIPMSDSELAAAMGQDADAVDALLKLHRMFRLEAEDLKLNLEECLQFISETVAADETFADAVSEDIKKQLEAAEKEIASTKGIMLGEHYNRMIISAALEIEGEETFSFIGQMQKQANESFDGDVYLLNDSTMGYEMDLGFADELSFVTLLTVAAILVVVWITFRSLITSALLVAAIQAAVYITIAVITLSGITVNYISLILVQCILMGATIDYGILFLSNYRELRTATNDDKKSVLTKAMNLSIKTIMTSSLILVTCCLTVGFLMTQEIIAQTCSMIAYGTICSVLMVIFVLPAVTFILDKCIVPKRKKK